jgi:choline dehydrogenase
MSATAKMGPAEDPFAVVDHELKVYGIQGLRIIDASIMPTITSGNINAPVYMIAEKGADMIKELWRTTKKKRKKRYVTARTLMNIERPRSSKTRSE